MKTISDIGLDKLSKQIIIIGTGGHARVIYSLIITSTCYEIIGFLDENFNNNKELIGQKPVLGNYSILSKLLDNGVKNAIIAIGDNYGRAKMFENARKIGFELPSLVHKTAILEPEVSISPGTIVAAGSIICCFSKIGENCIINTGSTIDHECKIGNNVHVAPGVNIAGRVELGDYSFIGIGAKIRDKVKIGKQCTVGAGSVVLSDVYDNSMVAGVPAKLITKRANQKL